jgi:hypothetical protein
MLMDNRSNNGESVPTSHDKKMEGAKRLVGETWGFPASVAWYGNFVVITGRELSRRLESLYRSGVREVEVVVDVPGRRLVATGRIYRRYMKQRNRTYYFIYPRHAAQVLLRELYFMYRGDAAPNAKTPMPAVVVAIIPAEGV